MCYWRSGDHPTATELFIRAKKRMPAISFWPRFTNCLETLVDCGLAKQVNVDREATRYCPNLEDHGHFICRALREGDRRADCQKGPLGGNPGNFPKNLSSPTPNSRSAGSARTATPEFTMSLKIENLHAKIGDRGDPPRPRPRNPEGRSPCYHGQKRIGQKHSRQGNGRASGL